MWTSTLMSRVAPVTKVCGIIPFIWMIFPWLEELRRGPKQGQQEEKLTLHDSLQDGCSEILISRQHPSKTRHPSAAVLGAGGHKQEGGEALPFRSSQCSGRREWAMPPFSGYLTDGFARVHAGPYAGHGGARGASMKRTGPGSAVCEGGPGGSFLTRPVREGQSANT